MSSEQEKEKPKTAEPTLLESNGESNSEQETTDVVTEPEKKPDLNHQDQGQVKPSKTAAMLAVLVLLIGIAVAVGGAYVYQQQQALMNQISQLDTVVSGLPVQWKSDIRSADDKTHLQTLASRIDQISSALEQRDEGIAQREEAINEHVKQLEESLQVTHGLVARDQRGWQLAEVEYLLRISVQRLALAGDFDSATAALIAADRRLHEMSDTQLIPARRAIAREITLLRGAERPDVEGTAFALSEMIKRVRTLPLRFKNQSPSTDEAVATGEKTGISGFFEQLVIVKRVDQQVVDSALSLEAGEVLRLELQAAQIATLRQDGQNFSIYMAAAIKHATEYYETSQSVTKRYIEDMERIATARLTAGDIRLGEALKVLQQLVADYQVEGEAS